MLEELVHQMLNLIAITAVEVQLQPQGGINFRSRGPASAQ
jgi:hypothetical protein